MRVLLVDDHALFAQSLAIRLYYQTSHPLNSFQISNPLMK